MKKLFISAGHSNTDPGAIGNGTTEFKEVSLMAREVVKELRDKGADAVLVPIGISLKERIAWVNRETQAGDYLVELHMNAFSDPKAEGAEAYYLTGSTYAQDICRQFLNTYVNNMSIKLRGVYGDTSTRHKRLGIIRDTPPLAILVELGFISNKKDLEAVRSGGKDALVKACMEMLGIEMHTEAVSLWAKDAVQKCIDKKIMVFWTQPRELVGTVILEHALKNAGVIEKVSGDGLTKERLAVVFDRLGLLD